MSMEVILLQNMGALVSGILSFARVFMNQIPCFISNATTMYSASHLKVTTGFYFFDCSEIVNLLSPNRLSVML
jgi:hypothetical protein